MAIFSVSGLSSGINYNDMISKILEVERQPIYRLQKKQSTYNERINVYSDLSTKLSVFKSAADALRTAANFYAKKASSSDTTILDASATNSASAGNYTIAAHSVAGKIQLAQNEQEVHSGVSSSTTVVNSSGSDKAFQYTYAGTQRTLTVANNTTLEGLRDLINSDSGNPGVTATIINDGSAYKLVLTGKDTGSTKTITIDAGTTLDGTETVDFRSTTFTTTQTAQDARLKVNGIDITRSSNTISDVITGVTLTLKKESTSSVTVSVTNDTDSIKKKIEDFVNAYNNVISLVSTKAFYDISTRRGGPLTGEATPREIVNKLRSIIGSRVSGLPEDMRVLSQIGITTGSDGKLSINSTKLNDKLTTNLAGVSNLFNATGGVAVQVWDYTDAVTDSIDGALALRKKGLETLVGNIADDIIKIEDRLNKREETLRRQFASLESLLGGLTSQGAFLSNQITIWGKR